MTNTPAHTSTDPTVGIGARPLGGLLCDIAAKSPAPGGGAVASIAAALSASLAGMVLAYSTGKKDLAQHHQAHEALAQRCATAACQLLELADADAAAYARLNALQRLDADDPRRVADLAHAARRCVEVPHAVQALCLSLLEGFHALAPIANRWLLSDLKIAAILAEAAVRASDCNVEANASTLGAAVSREAEREAQAQSLASCERAGALLHEVASRIDATHSPN